MPRTDISYESNFSKMETQFQRLGHPGRFIHPMVIPASTIVNLTGSNYGFGAIQVVNATNVEITASNGAGLEGSDFETKSIHEIGLKRIKIVNTGKVIVYKRQQ